MLEQLLVTIMVAAGEDSELREEAQPFALAVVRHFALLFAAGWASQNTPAVPPSSRHVRYSAMGGVPACVAVLKHLDPRILLDSFQSGLGVAEKAQRAAMVQCMSCFVDALLEVGAAQAAAEEQQRRDRQQEADSGSKASGKSSKGQQQQQQQQGGSGGPQKQEGRGAGGGGQEQPQQMQEGEGAPAAAAAVAAQPTQQPADAAAAAAGGGATAAQQGEEKQGAASAAHPPFPTRYASVLHELMVRAMHCCYGDTWPVRLGGISALTALAGEPGACLPPGHTACQPGARPACQPACTAKRRTCRQRRLWQCSSPVQSTCPSHYMWSARQPTSPPSPPPALLPSVPRLQSACRPRCWSAPQPTS